jgi:hypothetical protein
VTQGENTVLLLGFVALVTLFLVGRRERREAESVLPATADMPDVWSTPFYLRSNMPLADWRNTGFAMPQTPQGSWSLGVPQQIT